MYNAAHKGNALSSHREKKGALTLKEKNFTLGSTKLEKKPKRSKPWLDSKGRLKSDKEIETLGQSWSATTWDEYLKATESNSSAQDNITASFFCMDSDTAVNGHILLEYLRNINEFESLEEHLSYALKFLTPRERKILKMKYWQGLSQAQISRKLKISECSVSNTRNRGLKKLKKGLASKDFHDRINTLKSLRNRPIL